MKKIGLLVDCDDNKLVFNQAYFNYAKRFSPQVELIHPYDSDLITDLDLLILPGGADVLPQRYGEAKEPYCGSPNWNYEWFDANILPQYIFNLQTPVFGICRGLQTLNVLFDGSLNQHIYEPSNQSSRKELVHFIETCEGPFSTFRVNSLHHQSINKVGDGIKVLARGFHQEKGKRRNLQIEAIKHEDYPVAAVQFHPEELVYNKEAKPATEWVDKLILSIMK